MKYYTEYISPAGLLYLAEEAGAVTDVSTKPPEGSASGETPLLTELARCLDEYFAGERRGFTLPLSQAGTPFRRLVWDALRGIPYGETRSYGEVARLIGNEKAVRAVGQASGANPVLILTPCHRVIGADGSLTGFGGGMEMKRFLLDLERGNQ